MSHPYHEFPNFHIRITIMYIGVIERHRQLTRKQRDLRDNCQRSQREEFEQSRNLQHCKNNLT